ncbi:MULTISPECIES: membrane protein [unclassified Clostridium]|uniref:YczE/YyaS/YitT family protein n=1 Tax=unclassified Clostridium TaxID=2614128 RepID=UPI0002974786|nr:MULTISPECIES: membrane protein [unclassified Clostridium]EKQ55414.1 MAG: putative membrane protein [Clostridium sp. Maddingley MBC34-26]
MNKAVDLFKRLILFFIGMSIIQFGVAIFLKTNIGSDPFTVFTQGLSFTLNKTGIKELSIVKLISGRAEVTPGIANMIILVLLFTIIVLTERKRIKIGTLICVVGVGPIIDFGIRIVSYFPIESYNYVIKAFFVIFGCLIIAIGFSVLSAANVGVAPNDIVPFIIKDKTKVEYRWIRMTLDGGFLIIGFILGGKIGLGTVISMLSTGPFIQYFLPYGERFANLVVSERDANLEDNITAAV